MTLQPNYTTFQLTTSRRGRQEPFVPTDSSGTISTHDLTKRSTDAGSAGADYYGISTHDLTKRSTTIVGDSDLVLNISTHDLTKRSTPDGGLVLTV